MEYAFCNAALLIGASPGLRFLVILTLRALRDEKWVSEDPILLQRSSAPLLRGAVYTGGWPCGPESYYVTIQAFVMNLDGQKSNVVEYTIHCNRGR